VYYLPRLFPGDAFAEDAAKRLDRLLDEWVINQDWDEPESVERSASHDPSGTRGGVAPSVRSVFDDLLDDRSTD